MAEKPVSSAKIDRRLVGEPVDVDALTLQPVAHLSGRTGWGGTAQAGGAGGWITLKPVEVLVRTPGGQESTVPLPDPTAAGLRQIKIVGLAVASICAVFMIIARVWR